MIRMLAVILLLISFPGVASAQDSNSTGILAQRENPITSAIDFFKDYFSNLFAKPDEADQVDPTGTLVAPFADQEKVKPLATEERYLALTASNNVAIDQPHRNDNDLGEWLMQAVAYAVSFDSTTYQKKLQELTTGFSPAGLEQYNNWVLSSGILSTLESGGQELHGLVNETPFLLNQGVVNGRYRWLFEIPVMVSFIPRGVTEVTPETTRQNQKLVVSVQIGRIPNSVLEHGVQIESWSVRNDSSKK